MSSRTSRTPVLTFIIPFIEVMKIIDVRETPRTGDRQQVITRDNVAVIVNATIFSQVVDVRLALFTNSDYLVSVDNLARTSVRAVFGSHHASTKRSPSASASARCCRPRWKRRPTSGACGSTAWKSLRSRRPTRFSRPWPSRSRPTRRSARASSSPKVNSSPRSTSPTANDRPRSKRPRVHSSPRSCAPKVARQAQILEAEGRSQAIASVYAAIKAQAPDPTLVAILQLDTLSKFAESPNTKLIIPAESSALLGAAQAIKSVMEGVPANAHDLS